MRYRVTSHRSTGLNVPVDPQRPAGPWLLTLAPLDTWGGELTPAQLAWLEAQPGVSVTAEVPEPEPAPVVVKPAQAPRTKGKAHA